MDKLTFEPASVKKIIFLRINSCLMDMSGQSQPKMSFNYRKLEIQAFRIRIEAADSG